MKIRMTVSIPDHLRKSLAVLLKTGETTKKGLLTRKATAAYIRQVLDQGANRLEVELKKMADLCAFRKLTPEEETVAKEAIGYLRASGKTEEQIRAWVWMQWARWDLVYFKPSVGSQSASGSSSSSASINP